MSPRKLAQARDDGATVKALERAGAK